MSCSGRRCNMARYCPLFSGSSGNCTYVGDGDGGVLIDAGVSARRIETALLERGIDPWSIHAVFVTHEHADHVTGLRVLVKRYGYTVYASGGTMEALIADHRVEANAVCREIGPEGAEAGGFFVEPFPTPHDSRESCGYRIHTRDDRLIAVATDIGHMTDTIRQAIGGCDLVQIESNHDVRMLEMGTYPYYLKKRILADRGHLSNEACAAELFRLAQSGTSRFVLAHLSRENNTPELAAMTARSALHEGGLQEQTDYLLRVAAPCDSAGLLKF